MKCRFLPILFFFLLVVAPALGGEPERFRPADPEHGIREELLRPEERQFYRERLWELKTEAERERFRDQQRQMLEERARALRLPPPAGEAAQAPAAQRTWPDDGLRRWPEERAAADGLRRWDGKSARTGKEAGKESPLRRWSGGSGEEKMNAAKKEEP